MPTTSHGLEDYGSWIGQRRVARACQGLQSTNDGSRAGDNGSRASDDGSSARDIGLCAGDDGSRACENRSRAGDESTTNRRSDAYICACSHPYMHTVHFFPSTVDLCLTRRLCISYPIPTSKFKKNW